MTEHEVKQARQETEQRIKERSTEYFSRDKSGKGYICPICGSGSGTNGTGITTKDGEHFTCWRGCFKNADIFDIIGLQYNLGDDFNAKFDKARDIFHMTLYTDNFSHKATYRKGKIQSEANTEENYTEFYNMAEKSLTQTDYHRGIRVETLKRFHVGFCPNWRHQKAPDTVPTSPRLIIPVWKGGYLARDTRANLTEEQNRFSKMRVGTMRLFNEEALKQEELPVLIVEGEIDAMSIEDAGGKAVALCSVSNVRRLLEAVKEQPPKVPLIIMLDRDEAGVKATEQLIKGLKEIKFFSYRQVLIPESYKDANEFLMSNREEFTKWITGEANKVDVESMKEEEQQREQEEREGFDREAVVYYLNDFMQEVKRNREGRAISTGFENFDEIFDGGLYPELYFVGANSSLGKTTLVLQIADNIARSGKDGVLIFSLEMARSELIAKSLSRLSLIKSIERYQDKKYAKTTRGVLRGEYNVKEAELLEEAIKDYATWGENIRITQGVGDVGVEEIREKTEQYIKYKGKPPVIVIDYLQILAPYNEKYTDKQNTDKNVLELKRISRDYQIPVIGISSFNRENYKQPVSMASFKESGAIEYSSDVLIGLQYNGWDKELKGDKEESDSERLARINSIMKQMEEAARAGRSQKIQGKILKNRNGSRGSVLLEFFPMFNYFRVPTSY